MAGANATEEALVDQLYMQWKDVFKTGSEFSYDALKAGGSLKGVPDWNTVGNGQKLTPFQASVSALRIFEAWLKKAKGGYLVGKKSTYVDLALWMTLFELEEEDHLPAWATKLKLPCLKAFKAKMETPALLKVFILRHRGHRHRPYSYRVCLLG